MSLSAHLKGLAGEDIAARLLAAQGVEILARRLKTPYGEIDILAREARALVIVEVKARRDHARAAYALRPAQARRLGAAALYVQAERPDWTQKAPDLRIDLVMIDAQGRAERLENVCCFNDLGFEE